VRIRPDKRWQRCLLFVLCAAVFAVHAVAFAAPGQSAEPHHGVTQAAAVVAADALHCDQAHLPDGAHEACLDPTVDRCASTLAGASATTVDTADQPACTGAPATATTGRPRGAEHRVSLAHLQVWRR
jgi:hypothetical protein